MVSSTNNTRPNSTIPRKPRGGGSFTPNPFQDIHQELLPYMWTIAINIGIFLALYRYRKYSMVGHFLIGLGVACSTLITSMPLLLDKPIPTVPSVKTTHVLIGIAIVAVIFLEVVIGSLSKLLNFCKTPSLLIYWLGKIHRYLGYALTILCKFQVYYILKQTDKLYWILLGQDILFALLLIIRKFYFPTLQQRIEASHGQIEDVKSITSLQDIKLFAKEEVTNDRNDKDYCSFGNYVYDLKPMALMHPAGYQVLRLIRNREVDRFMYGMFSVQKLPSLPAYSHTARSLDLLGAPIAKINIPSPYKGMKDMPLQVTVEQILMVSKKGEIYEIFLKTDSPLHFEGYSQVKQLGRFYSLTINNKTTRLYTAVNCLHKSNLQFLKSAGLYEDTTLPKVHYSKKQTQDIQLQTERFSNEQLRMNQLVPLLMKVYQGGTLPNQLIQGEVKTLQLSSPKGFGLSLADIKAGTILIVAGGTGLYPFSDLIDLLYKDYYAQSNPAWKGELLKLNPILESRPFKNHDFQLLLACNHIEDIHPLTLHQLKILSSSGKLHTKLRLKETTSDLSSCGIDLVSAHFESMLDSQLTNITSLSRVWLCGPPRMCESLSIYFDKKYPAQDIVHFV